MAGRMKVLWVVNLTVPRGSSLAEPGSATFGGWISSMLAQLAASPEVEMAVVARSAGGPMEKAVFSGVTHYYLPLHPRDPLDVTQADCRAVLDDFGPDLLHAEGTEMAYTRRFLRSWSGANVVSVQGILQGLEPHEYGGLAVEDFLFSMRPRQMLIGAGLIAARHLRFRPRLKHEAESLQLAQNILGRTQWDRAHTFALNPRAPYFTVHRVLRPAFYERPWTLEGAERHSLFVGNAFAPRKGVHFVLQAMAQLRDRYPDMRLYVAGPRLEAAGWRDWKKQVGYPAYLLDRIRALGLQDRVIFTDVLSSGEMADRMRRSHAFILSSLIENSPNSLAEAMALGVPTISAYAGGAPDMAEDGREALFYRPIDPQMLAWRITQIFDSDALARKLGAAARKRALKTHDPVDNRDRLLAAYRAILT